MAKDMQEPNQNQNRDVLLPVQKFLKDISIFEDKEVHASILFADLVGSTEFKRRQSVRDGLAKVVRHNEVVRNCVRSFDGSVVKYIGDGVMAKFEGKQHEFRTIQAGRSGDNKANGGGE